MMDKVKTYLQGIDDLGMYQVWHNIVNSPIPVECYGELYEIGLAHVNKNAKKSMGKYFTPDDVATLMSKWLLPLPGENICDVCCGVGNLILAYLKLIGHEEARKLILSDKLWLYDADGLAIRIAIEAIAKTFGRDLSSHIHMEIGDFLSRNTHLPSNCKVISNPPYAKVESKLVPFWKESKIVDETQELYAAMMEKILDESCSSVIITPQNYLGRKKFGSLREKISEHSGFIVPFDNTPGQVFNGRKHGVFNSNTQNQVRPAIMVCDNKMNEFGWRVAGMVRFKNGERDKVLTPECLESMVGNVYQKPGINRFKKCFPILEETLFKWELFSQSPVLGKGSDILKNYIDEDGDYYLNFVDTCRYFTVAYISDLYRAGKRMIAFKDEETRDIAYCFLNSSFCYWHWRLYDGEITYQKGMLDSMPVFFKKLQQPARKRLVEIAKEMQALEPTFLVTKKNSGKMMESIRFPDKYREEINEILLKSIGSDKNYLIFNSLHAHSIFL